MKKNVLFIIHSLSNGGAERVMSYLTNGFPNEKYNKYLIVYNRSSVEYDFEAKCINLDLVSRNNIFSKIYVNIRRVMKVKKIKKELMIEESISLLDNPNLLNLLSKGKDRVIISIRNHKSSEIKGKGKIIYKLVGKLLYNKAERIVAISKGVGVDLIQNYNIEEEKTKVIYNPINIEKIFSLKEENIEEEYKNIFGDNTIINVGRLTNQKGQWHLIRAFSKVVKSIPNAKLVILGEGELRKYLENIIEELGIGKNVFLLGFKKNPFKYISNSKIFVLSSLYEGFGNVITEAMACKTAVIATDCKYGPREIISGNFEINTQIKKKEMEKFGILVPEVNDIRYISTDPLDKSEDILAEAMIELLKNKKNIEKYEMAGLKRVEDFQSEKIMQEWLEL